MKNILLGLLLASAAFAQSPASNIQIGSTNVSGGTSGHCLSVSSTRKLAQVVCGTGSGTVTSVSGTANQISVTTGTTTAVVGFTATPIMPNGTTATAQSAGDATSKLANDAFVASVIASINPAVSVQAATIAVLSNTPTYSNGTAGVGATLTAGSFGALTVDGYTVLLNDRILVKNQASTFQNGVYTLTTLGTGGVDYILTRATDYNAITNINYTGTIPVIQGGTLSGTGWNGPTNIATVGTDAITYTQAAAGNSGGPPGGNIKAVGNLTNFAFVEGAGGKSLQTVTSPNCTDTVGQHLNYASATGAITCGTSVPASTVNASSPGTGIAHFAGSTQTVTSSKIVAGDITSTITSPAAGTSCTFVSPSTICVATGTFTGTVPVPTRGDQFCVMNDDNIATVITLSAIGSSARYENQARTAYGTAGTGTLVSAGAVKDFVCLYGLDSTHYLFASGSGTWTAN